MTLLQLRARRIVTKLGWLISAAVLSALRTSAADLLFVTNGFISRAGVSGEILCAVQLRFSGALASNALLISDVRITHAEDDAGDQLAMVRRPGRVPGHGMYNPLVVPHGQLWYEVVLACPGPSAHMIKRLEGEVDLAVPTAENGGRFTIENFMAQPGRPIRDPRLDKYGLNLIYHTLETYHDSQRTNRSYFGSPSTERCCFTGIYGNPTNPPRKSVAIQIDDPEKKLIGLAFERTDGNPLEVTETCEGLRLRCYTFDTVPPKDLKLVVFVAAPGVIRTERFVLENIWLPWDRSAGSPYADPSELRASAEGHVYKTPRSTNAYLRLTFTGGPITNAYGVRRVMVLRAVDENGHPIVVEGPKLNCRRTSSFPLVGRVARVVPGSAPKQCSETIPFDGARSVKRLGFVEGMVEVYDPSTTNGGMLIVDNLPTLSGQRLTLPGTVASNTQITFKGLVDLGTEMARLNQAGETYLRTGSIVAGQTTNSLWFEVVDPEGYVVELEFMRTDDSPVRKIVTLHFNNGVVYNLAEVPSDLRLVVYLAAPGAIQVYPFRAENVHMQVHGQAAQSRLTSR